MIKSILLVVIIAIFATHPVRASGQKALPNPASPSSSEKLAAILRPYVAPLDRDLWTFRYEAKGRFKPATANDVIARIGPWADRFYDPSVLSGVDTGPGVYVATDPAATATWGGVNPQLFAIKIKKGTRVLIGDQYRLDGDKVRALTSLAAEMNCGASTTQISYDLGQAVGYFRMSPNLECREAIIEAVRKLKVKALTYGFNSAPLPDCRVTGTAISIINSEAISKNEINYYSKSGNIEGQPLVAPFVKQLYFEAKDDYYSQSLLANLEVWEDYKNAYGFFDSTGDISVQDYRTWKDEHILKCGTKWSIETPDVEPTGVLAKLRTEADPMVSSLLIRLALIYRAGYKQNSIELPSGVAPELRAGRIRAIHRRYPESDENKIRLVLGLVPESRLAQVTNKQEYISILKNCLREYETLPFAKVLAGECGVEPED